MRQSKRDYNKVERVINSCTTIFQLNTAMNMVHQYGKVYGLGANWRKLDINAWGLWKSHMDSVEYRERLREINEQETPVSTKG